MLPIMLASFIFDALVIPSVVGKDRSKVLCMRLPMDEPLGFEAAVAALGLKANVSEADHPLLCEGTRRQRGELAITLLVFYKDDCYKVARIMDRLLDREVHQLLKSPIISSYYSSNPPLRSQFTNLKREECEKVMSPLNSYVAPSDLLPTEMSRFSQSRFGSQLIDSSFRLRKQAPKFNKCRIRAGPRKPVFGHGSCRCDHSNSFSSGNHTDKRVQIQRQKSVPFDPEPTIRGWSAFHVRVG